MNEKQPFVKIENLKNIMTSAIAVSSDVVKRRLLKRLMASRLRLNAVKLSG